MISFAPILMGALVATTPATPRPADPDRTLSIRQPAPLVLDVGTRSLGFDPLPFHPTVALGSEFRLLQRRFYELHFGMALGFHRQAQLEHAFFLDNALGLRLTAPCGLYGDIDVIVGGQLARVTSTTYRADESGHLRAARAPLRAAARLGLGLSLGVDLSRFSSLPIRIFARYRQYAQTPFMLGNGLPAMGFASLTGGIAVEMRR